MLLKVWLAVGIVQVGAAPTFRMCVRLVACLQKAYIAFQTVQFTYQIGRAVHMQRGSRLAAVLNNNAGSFAAIMLLGIALFLPPWPLFLPSMQRPSYAPYDLLRYAPTGDCPTQQRLEHPSLSMALLWVAQLLVDWAVPVFRVSAAGWGALFACQLAAAWLCAAPAVVGVPAAGIVSCPAQQFFLEGCDGRHVDSSVPEGRGDSHPSAVEAAGASLPGLGGPLLASWPLPPSAMLQPTVEDTRSRFVLVADTTSSSPRCCSPCAAPVVPQMTLLGWSPLVGPSRMPAPAFTAQRTLTVLSSHQMN